MNADDEFILDVGHENFLGIITDGTQMKTGRASVPKILQNKWSNLVVWLRTKYWRYFWINVCVENNLITQKSKQVYLKAYKFSILSIQTRTKIVINTFINIFRFPAGSYSTVEHI